MAGLRFTDLQSVRWRSLDFTSLTLDEFQQLVPPFERVPMPYGGLADGWETADRAPVYRRQNCPLLTPEARLLFILAYLKTYALQVVHGRLFGMVQSKAHQWIHPGSRASGCVRRFLSGSAPAYIITVTSAMMTPLARHTEGVPYGGCDAALVPWPTCRWCWGWYASSTWLRSSIPSALHPAHILSCGRGVEALLLAILDGHHAFYKVGTRLEERGMVPLLQPGITRASLHDYRPQGRSSTPCLPPISTACLVLSHSTP